MNLIEVTLALAILTVGSTVVLSLFPVGFEQNRSSIGKNYTSLTSNTVFSYISAKATATKDSWNIYFGNNGGILYVTNSDTSLITNDKSDLGTTWSPLANSDDTGIYGTAISSVYGIKVISLINNTEHTDFLGKARLWYEKVGKNGTSTVTVADTDLDIDTSIAVRLNLEISWPAERPYLTRNKNTFSQIIYNNS